MTDNWRGLAFFMPMDHPPTATAQERQSTITRSGKRMHYKNARLQAAEDMLTFQLRRHAPDEPLEGAVELLVYWYYPTGKTHKHGEWRVTRPDTDNLSKLLKDIMTRLGYWHDDAQVCRETVCKVWSNRPGIFIRAHEMDRMADGMEEE